MDIHSAVRDEQRQNDLYQTYKNADGRNVGIAVRTDPAALEWQQLDASRESRLEYALEVLPDVIALMDAARHVVAAPTAEHIHRLYETLTVLQENTR